MRKIFLFLILLCWFATSVCNPVDRESAQQVAANFWSAVVGESENHRWNELSSEFGFQQFYFFVREGSAGFVLVSADDCVQPILGYSTKSLIPATIPAHVSSFLQGYEAEIAYCKAHQIMPTEEISSQWSSLLQGTYTMQNTTSVSPLLATTWGQSPYYNDLCPEQGGVHALTGCVATALAQVMKYWNWPVNGMGSHSYQDATYGTLSANFGATTYNWSDMPDALTQNSTPAQINAVATIMYHAGVAVEMEYGEEASSAYLSAGGNSAIPSGENALKNYFRYKSTLHDVSRSSVSNNVWISTLMSELNAGRPVLERGSGDEGGHAFVCDGYDGNGLFHINWGWGGYLNGYFAHNDLNPGGLGFNDDNSLVVGVEPEWRIEVTPMYLSFEQAGGTDTLTVSSYSEDASMWNATTNVSWLSLTPTSGAGAGATTTISVTAMPNNSNNTREGEITITQGVRTRIVRVVQHSYPHIITLLSSDANMGSAIGGGTYVSGTTIELEANANSGYRFTGWSDGTTENPRTLFVTESDTLIAYFADLGDDEKQYDNGDYETSLGAGGSFTWGVRYPANELAPYPYLSAIKIMDLDPGSCEVRIYQGGTTSPQTLVATHNFTLPGSNNWHNMVLPTPLQIDHTLPLWIVLNSTDISHPAAGTNYAGNPDGSWVYLGGSWSSVCDLDYNLTWMVRAKLSEESNPTQFTVTATASNANMGSVIGGGTYVTGSTIELEANANSGYRFTGWSDGTTENPRLDTVTSDITLIANFADLGDDEKQYDNGNYETSLGAGGSFTWGVRYPANELAPYPYLSAIKIMDHYSGSCEVRIYQGGTTEPQTLVVTHNFTLPGSDTWYDMVLPTPLQIDHTLPLWIVLTTTDISYPAAGTNYAGNPDGSWVYLGGSWNSVCNLGYNLTWMVRAKLSESNMTLYTVTATASNPNMGSVTGGGTYVPGAAIELEANAYSGYRFTGWSDGTTENPRLDTVTSDITLIANFADLGDDEKQYDNGNYETSLGAGGSFTWGVRYPANELAPYPYLSAIKIMDYYSGSCEVRIYQGGTTSPQTLVATHNFTLPGSNNWYDMVLPTPLQIDHTLPLWIVLSSTDISYPAAGTNYAGNPDGSWVYLGGSWNSVCDLGYNLTWMVRAKLSESNLVQYTVTTNTSNANMGSVTGGGTYVSGTTIELRANANSGYRFTGWNDGSTENPRSLSVTSNITLTAHFADLGDDEKQYDNGDFETSLGAGGSLTWGVRYPANELAPYPYLSAIKIMDRYSGTCEVRIYQGGTTSPQTLVATHNFTLPGSNNWHDMVLPTPLQINHTLPLWIVLKSTDISHPAAGANYAGNPDGSWVYSGGSWSSVCDFDHNLTWMVRAKLSSTVAIDELSVRNLNIYPNPTSHALTVEGVTFATLELYDNVGKRIAVWYIEDESKTLDLSPYSSGIYYLRVVDSKGSVETQKVIKR